MKRLTILVFALMVGAAFTVTAVGKGEGGVTPPKEQEIIEYDTVSILWSDIVPEHPSLWDEEILKRFGIKFNIEYLSRAAYKEKMNVMLATGEGLEVCGSVGSDVIIPWATEGHLIPISDYLDKIPNYREQFTESEWELMNAWARTADGKLYFLPRKRKYALPFTLEIWRKGTLNKMGLSIPKTTDEFYETMKKAKEKQPNAVVYTVWTAFPQLFTMPFRTTEGWYLDPDSNKLEFGPTTDKFRDALIFSAKMYSAGLTDQEWTPAGKEHYFEGIYQGRCFWSCTYPYAVDAANEQMKSVDPDAGWMWTVEFVSHYPGKTGMTTGINYPFTWGGPFITKQCPEEKIERYLEYLNWSASEEGSIFHQMGVEGITFEYKDGKPVYMDHIITFDNPDGTNEIATYGFGGGVVDDREERNVRDNGINTIEIIQQQWDAIKDFKELPFIPMIVWKLTKEQEKDLADLETVITDVWKEWAIKFITGIVDPSEGAQWNAFQAELKKVGIDDVRAIREEAFKKSGIWRGR